jgi:UDP-N-acetylglucosamine 2-epimerase (non-hydrolysing)
MKKIIHIVGARPNFMKAAPVIEAFQQYPDITQVLVHTGQHYDEKMSEVFFQQLGMPKPDINLEVGSGSHASQTAEIMVRFEKVLLGQKPDLLVVYGDVNSTIATALVASKLGVKIAHVEAGLRSWDRGMPEEINRVLTDQISDVFFTPSVDGDEHLQREGIDKEKIFFVGNVMIDTLVRLEEMAKKPAIEGIDGDYILVTLHRPSNVDNRETLQAILERLVVLSELAPVVFPIHPRTRARIDEWCMGDLAEKLNLVEPLGYLEFLWLIKHSRLVLTDSGGIQEETTYLKVPCLTLRENTERPITCTIGTNILVGNDLDLVDVETRKIFAGEAKAGQVPDLWDGEAGNRIAKITRGLLFN